MRSGCFSRSARPAPSLCSVCAAIERVLDNRRVHCRFVDPAQTFPLSLKTCPVIADEDGDRLASSL
jgi:hypothetical protein